MAARTLVLFFSQKEHRVWLLSTKDLLEISRDSTIKSMSATLFKNKQSGFTIVELLIVIVVIAILAAITIVAYNGIQSRAHDSQRVSDMRSIKQQIEMYYVDNGSYPLCAGTAGCTTTATSSNKLANLPIGAAANLLDPKNQAGEYGYYYSRNYKKTGPNSITNTGSPNDYIIAMRLENSSAATFSAFDNTKLNWLDGDSQ